MNRLSPLVTRTPRTFGRARVATIAPLRAPAQSVANDLRLFATAWLGGVIFFTTLLA